MVKYAIIITSPEEDENAEKKGGHVSSPSTGAALRLLSLLPASCGYVFLRIIDDSIYLPYHSAGLRVRM
jgi:hypothetical protein